MKKATVIEGIIKAAICSAIVFVIYYLTLPAINPQSVGFWLFISAVLLIYGLPFGLFDLVVQLDRKSSKAKTTKKHKGSHVSIMPKQKMNISISAKVFAGLLITSVTVLFGGLLISSPLFNATRWADVIEVNEHDFAKDMPNVTQVKNIALMDTNSARILGERKLGALADVVSQFEVSESYTQINYKGAPKKVAPLEYAAFFKWLGNRDKGIPGYIMVDAVENYADYGELEHGMKYSESAYFSEDLRRALRFAYPTKIFRTISFEVNEEGQPFYVVACEKPKVGLFGARDINEIILFNPIDGSHELMAVEDTPKWIDIVFDGYLACDKYDWQGLYSGGFFNSIIGNKGCKQTTDDFGYIMLDDDVWYFTGVTSVTGDASNIGFILTNARTGIYKFYPVIGAEEHSAMGAAEGQVQEKGYVASFPSLINVSGQPSYIMVLKDANGLVKLYAIVNVQQYNIVATGETQEEAMSAYLKRLAQSDFDITYPEDSITEIKISDIKYLTISGSTVVYVTSDDGKVYKFDFTAKTESIVTKKIGDVIYAYAQESSTEGVYTITAFSDK